MKKLLGVILILIISMTSASANVISSDMMKKDLQEVILQNYSTKTDANLEIKITMLPFQNMVLPDGHVRYELINGENNAQLTSREIIRVNIFVNNTLQRTLSVPIEVKAYGDVLVATSDIPRNQPINQFNVRVKRTNIADKCGYIVTKDMINKDIITKKDFKDGEFIDKRFVRVRPDVVRNSDIRIILNSNDGFQIAIDGVAQSDGVIGEYVTVENKAYKRVYRGKIIGENQVLVNI